MLKSLFFINPLQCQQKTITPGEPGRGYGKTKEPAVSSLSQDALSYPAVPSTRQVPGKMIRLPLPR